ncbi:ATP-binding cassette sub- D member 1 [Asimina triloba]
MSIRKKDPGFLCHVFHMSGENIDADQRITHDVEKLTTDLAGLVTGMVKPSVDILWFMHARLRTHAESVAFFGGGARERAMVDSRFNELLGHSKILLKKKWLFGILDDFITKQLPHNVTWGLSLLYAMEHKGDRALTSTQGELAHALRFLASVVSQSFMAFGDILELHRKFLELSGGVNRIFELEELLDAAQSDVSAADSVEPSEVNGVPSEDGISFYGVDVITPGQKLLARQLTCSIQPGKSLLVTGPNGSGKSSIFRVLRGLWPIVSGSLVKPHQTVTGGVAPGSGMFYIPQRPYTCLGSLRDQIIYPLSHEEAERRALRMSGNGEGSDAALLDRHLRTILENVRLLYLLERYDDGWDASVNWEDVLSLGEQQRLGMARLFFRHPKFGILDECTNATSVEIEEHLYKLAQGMGITVITTSQRPALIPYHSTELRLIDGEFYPPPFSLVIWHSSSPTHSHCTAGACLPDFLLKESIVRYHYQHCCFSRQEQSQGEMSLSSCGHRREACIQLPVAAASNCIQVRHLRLLGRTRRTVIQEILPFVISNQIMMDSELTLNGSVSGEDARVLRSGDCDILCRVSGEDARV